MYLEAAAIAATAATAAATSAPPRVAAETVCFVLFAFLKNILINDLFINKNIF